MRGRTGTVCDLTYDSAAMVVEGDFIRTRAGSCYRVLSAYRSAGRGVWKLHVVRLDREAVQEGDEGVHLLVWWSRRKVVR